MQLEAEILVAGSLHLDIIVRAPSLPRIDQTVSGSAVSYAFGGKGGNQAIAAARMGASVAMAGRVGTDEFGKILLQALQDSGVEHSRVGRSGTPSGISCATILPDGSYAAVIVSGANLEIESQDFDFPAGCKALILQNEIPDHVNLELALRAKARGIRVILNAAPARAMPDGLSRLLDLLVVNRGEAADLLDQSEACMDPGNAALLLCATGAAAVIVTLGGDGVAAHCQTGFVEPAFKVKAVSSHGAGDTFLGALVAEWLRKVTLRQACLFGQAAAALHVSTPVEGRAALNQQAVRSFLAQQI